MSLNPLDTKSIEKLVLKNTLKSHYSEKAMIELVVGKIKEIPEYIHLKSDIGLTLIVCEMSTEDQLALANVVNFLHQNNSFLY